MGLDEAVLEGIGQLEEFAGRKLMVVAALGGPHYLVRTDIGKRNTIFVVLDDREIGKVVTKFYWDMTYYWSNFRYGSPDGSTATHRFAQYIVTINPRGQFMVIVGPAEPWDDPPPQLSLCTAVPSTKLLRFHSWEVEVSSVCATMTGWCDGNCTIVGKETELSSVCATLAVWCGGNYTIIGCTALLKRRTITFETVVKLEAGCCWLK